MQHIHGGDIYTYEGMIDFSVNINPFGPSKLVVETAKAAMDQIGNYPDIRCRKLREEMEKRLKLPGDFFIYGNGAAELIFSLVQAERPKKAVVPVPAFEEYSAALKSVGCKVEYYYKKEINGFALREDFLDLLNEDVDMVFLCSPDNPTGRVTDRKFLKKVLRKCEEYHIRMILDECFIEFTENEKKASLQSLISLHGNLFILRAFTKMHAVPGLRIGYGICSDTGLLRRIEEARQPWSVSVPAQAAALAALKERQRVKTTREFVTRERKWMESQLSELGITWFESGANFLLLKSSLNLFEIMGERGILIRDCQNFRGLPRGFYRIAIRQRGDNQRLLDVLREISVEGETDGEINHDPGNHVERGEEHSDGGHPAGTEAGPCEGGTL